MAKQLMFITGLLLLVSSAEAFKFLSKLFPEADGVITEDHTHCYDKKDTCTKAFWAKLTCDQSCVCKGYHWGVCVRSRHCIRKVPWQCQCYGKWFGRNKDFCKQ